MRKDIRFIICLIAAILILIIPAAAEPAEAYVRIKAGAEAYAEPFEDENLLLGQFGEYSIAQIDDFYQDPQEKWLCVRYNYDSFLKADRLSQETEDELSGIMTVYVRKNDTVRLPNEVAHQIQPNYIATKEEILKAGPGTIVDFEPSLLASRSEGTGITVNANDITEITSRPNDIALLDRSYANGTLTENATGLAIEQATYTSGIAGDIYYRTGTNTTAGSVDVTELLEGEGPVAAGLKAILENAPPYKTYMSYPADYNLASQYAAQIAINAYMHDFGNDESAFGFLEGTDLNLTNQFDRNYLAYAYWLYEQGSEAYYGYTDSSEKYITYEVLNSTEDEYWYISEIRVTTNCEGGWLAAKQLIPEGTVLRGIDREDENTYYGPEGTSIIRVATKKATAEPETIIYLEHGGQEARVYELKGEESSYYTLAGYRNIQTAKQVRIDHPLSGDITIKAKDANTGKGVADVGISIVEEDESGQERRYTVNTGSDGTASIRTNGGTIRYRATDLPQGYGFAGESRNTSYSLAEESSEILLEKVHGSLRVNVLTTNRQEPVAGVTLTLTGIKDGLRYEAVTDKNGNASFTGLELGNYSLKQETAARGYTKIQEPQEIRIESETEQLAQILNDPVNGSLMVNITDNLTGTGVAGITVTVYREKREEQSGETDEKGSVVFDNLQTGTYTIKPETNGTGYEGIKTAKTVYLKSDSYEEANYKLEPKTYQIEIYPRSESDLLNFNSEKPGKTSDVYTAYVESIRYRITAKEDIISGGNTIFTAGSVVTEADAASGKRTVAKATLRYPGSYMIDLIGKEAESYELNVSGEEREVIVKPICVDIPTQPVIITDGSGEAHSTLYIYPSLYKTYNAAPDGDGKVNAQISGGGEGTRIILPEGRYSVSPSPKTGKGSDTLIVFPVTGGKPQNYSFNPGLAQTYLYISSKYAETNAAVNDIIEYQITSGDETLLCEIRGEGYVPGRLSAGSDYIIDIPEGAGSAYMLSEGPVRVSTGKDQETHADIRLKREPVTIQISAAQRKVNGYMLSKETSGHSVATPYYRDIPLAGVQIELANAEGESVFTGMTDEAGLAYATDLTGDTYTLAITSVPAELEVAESSIPIKLNKDNIVNNTHNVSIICDIRETSLRITGLEPGKDYGIYSSEEMTGGYAVSIIHAETGECTVKQRLSAGKYEVRDMLSTDGKGTPFVIRQEGEAVYVPYAENGGIECSLYVYGDNRSLLGGVYLTIEGENGSFSGYTDDGGKAVFQLPDGKYKWKAVLAPEYYAVTAAEKTLVVDSLQSLSIDDSITLPRQGILLKVTDEYGEPLEDAVLEIRSETETRLATTDETGNALFTGIPYGAFSVTEKYAPPGWVRSTSEIRLTIDGTSPDYSTEPVAVLTNEPNTLEVSCRTTDGEPIAHVALEVYDTLGNILDMTYTEEAGTASLVSLPYGVYYIRSSTTRPDVIMDSNPHKVVVGNEYTSAKLSIQSIRGQVNIHVADSIGNPIIGLPFTISNMDDITGTSSTITTDAEGKAIGYFPEYGQYVIHQGAKREGLSAVDDIFLNVDSSYAIKTIHVELVPDSCSFYCYDTFGQPLPGISFKLVDRKDETVAEAISAEDGSVLFASIPEGNYEIRTVETDDFVKSVRINQEYQPTEEKYIYVYKAE